jgi:large subunit ribosomal protein L4
MQLDVLNTEGKQTGRTVNLPDEVFGIEPNDHVIYLAVKQYLAAKHQGTHNVKDRSDVKGSSRKLHRQKGTGGSRKGNIRNPLYRGGGVIFGPKPHSYDFKMNRKEKDLAKMSALSYKASGAAIRIVEDLKIETPKTKQLEGVLRNLEVSGKKILFVTPEYQDNVYRSLRNLPKVKGIVLSDMNTYDIVNSNFLVFTEEAVKVFGEGHAAENAEASKATAGETAAPEKKTAQAKVEKKAKAEKKAVVADTPATEESTGKVGEAAAAPEKKAAQPKAAKKAAPEKETPAADAPAGEGNPENV